MRGVHGCRSVIFTSASVIFSCFISTGSIQSAELIRTPSGVLARSLFDWENVSALEVEVSGLTRDVKLTPSGAEYFFSDEELCDNPRYRTVRLNETDETPWIELQKYCARDLNGAVSFMVIGDTQEYHDIHLASSHTIRQIAENNPQIQAIVNVGDIVSWGSSVDQWKKYHAVSATGYADQLPLVPIVGNHDGYSDHKFSNFDHLYATEQTASHYFLVNFGTGYLIVLNSVVDLLTKDEAAAQTTWLETTLKSISREKPVVVAYHHPAYSSGTSVVTMPLNPIYIQRHWLPLFEKFGVKLVLNGHDHFYERLSIRGVEYLTVSALAGGLSGPMYYHSKYSKRTISGHHTITIVTIDPSGEVTTETLDSLTGEHLD